MVLNSVKNNKKWRVLLLESLGSISLEHSVFCIYFFYCMSFSLNSFNSSIYKVTTRQRQKEESEIDDYLLSGLMETEQYL